MRDNDSLEEMPHILEVRDGEALTAAGSLDAVRVNWALIGCCMTSAALTFQQGADLPATITRRENCTGRGQGTCAHRVC